MSKNYLDKSGLSYFWSKLKTKFNTKQDTLVSGTNIKTINGASVVGSGDLTVEGTPEVAISTTQPSTPVKILIDPTKVVNASGFELNKIYPIGSLYFNTTGVNPSTFLGGTWQSFGAGRVLVGQDTNDTDFDTLLDTGGSKELQQHNHGSLWQAGSGAGTGTGDYAGMPAVFGSYAIPGMVERHTLNTGTGDSGNLQPYIVVSIWVRTA